jgi:hypothetical protein
MRVLNVVLVIGAIVAIQAPSSDAKDKKPMTILSVTDDHGLNGPYTQFDLKDDGAWTYKVMSGGKKLEAKSGKFNADKSKALLAFIDGLELEKHTRKREINVDDAPILSVQVGPRAFRDLAPETGAKVLAKVKEVITPKK